MNRSILALLVITAPLVWLFGPALVREETFVFRDAAHYYYPLFKYVNHQWTQGHLPLWNPLEETGRPLLADPTASVIYPGKLLLALPFQFATNYKLYIVAHLFLAAGATYFVARRWGAPQDGAALGGVSYALSGHVLFQYCNVVFLVGAAWLPLAFWALDRMLVLRSWRWAILLGTLLSLMVLGGDPQLAYHTGLLGLLYAWLLWRKRASARTDRPTSQVPARFWQNRLALLIASALVGLSLSAAQVLPSIEWSGRSDRAVFDSPRSLVELVSSAGRDDLTPAGRLAGLWRRPDPDSHHHKVFEFSVGPWRLIELVWPNISGRQFPVHRRWLSGIPSEGRIWTPTLYAGLIPLAAALMGIRFRHGSVRIRWLSWIMVLSTAASFGGYGLGWLLDEIRFALYREEFKPAALVPGFGGLYWFMTVILPGYVYFRYPAKLWTLASLGMSLLAAKHWQRLWSKPCPVLVTRFLLILATTSAAAAFFVVVHPGIAAAIRDTVPADALFGPIDARLAVRDAAGALVHAALTAAAFVWLLRSSGRSPHPTLRWVALGFTAVELTVAQSWLMPTAPVRQWETGSLFARCIQLDQQQCAAADGRAERVFRCSSSGWKPLAWSRESARDRQQISQRWDHDTLLPKYHLLHDIPAIETSAPFSSADYGAVLQVSREFGPLRSDGLREPHPAVLDSLGVAYVVAPRSWLDNASAETASKLHALAVEPIGDATCFRTATTFPRTWVVHNWEDWPELPATRSQEQLLERTRAVFFPAGQPRDLRHRAIVEGANQTSASPLVDESAPRESCRIVREQNAYVEIEVHLVRPGLVVLCDAYSPGWKCYVTTPDSPEERQVDLLRVNRVMRGVHLPRGDFRLIHRYSPNFVKVGLALSLFSWIGLSGLCHLLWVPRSVRGRPARDGLPKTSGRDARGPRRIWQLWCQSRRHWALADGFGADKPRAQRPAADSANPSLWV